MLSLSSNQRRHRVNKGAGETPKTQWWLHPSRERLLIVAFLPQRSGAQSNHFFPGSAQPTLEKGTGEEALNHKFFTRANFTTGTSFPYPTALREVTLTLRKGNVVTVLCGCMRTTSSLHKAASAERNHHENSETGWSDNSVVKSTCCPPENLS